jgi:hypothetical protein
MTDMERSPLTVLGINLSRPTAAIAAEVEDAFGAPVIYVYREGIREHAAAIVDRQYDTPTIEFRTGEDIDESTIFHELYHLKLITQGLSQSSVGSP